MRLRRERQGRLRRLCRSRVEGASTIGGQRNRSSQGIDVFAPIGKPERDLEAPVLQRACECLAEAVRRRSFELDHQIADARVREARPQQAVDDRDRKCDEPDDLPPEELVVGNRGRTVDESEDAFPDRAEGGDMVEFFDQTRLRELHARQVEAVRYLDGVFARLFDLLPDDTWVIVTSDHGELFGEERYFGHGPIMHEKVLEVPFVEGPVP